MATVITTKTKDKSGSVIKTCTCNHEFQDKTYGKGKRLMSIAKGGDIARCTVCKTEHKL